MIGRVTRDQYISEVGRLIGEGERLQSKPSMVAMRTWIALSDELLRQAWGSMDRYHLSWLSVGRPSGAIRGRAMTEDEEDAYVIEVADAKTAVLRMSLKAVARPVAELLYVLVIQKNAQRIVEFGTSHGYSTIHLAAAADKTGGRVYSVDSMPEKTKVAAAHLEAAGLRDAVTLATADAVDFASALPRDIDFVLVDIPIAPFVPALEDVLDRLSPGALFFVDGGPDGYWDSEQARPLVQRFEDASDFVVTRLPMEKQQLLAVKLDPAASGANS